MNALGAAKKLNSAVVVGLFSLAMVGLAVIIGAVSLVLIPILFITEIITSPMGRK